VTPEKSLGKQAHYRACAEMFLRVFGSDTEARLLSRREWDRFIRDRRTVRFGRSIGKNAGPSATA